MPETLEYLDILEKKNDLQFVLHIKRQNLLKNVEKIFSIDPLTKSIVLYRDSLTLI